MTVKGIAPSSDERAYNLVQSLNVPKLSAGEMEYDLGKGRTQRVDMHGASFPRGTWNVNNGIAAVADERGYVTLLPFSEKVSTALWNSNIPKLETMTVPFTNGLEPAGRGDKIDWQSFASEARKLSAVESNARQAPEVTSQVVANARLQTLKVSGLGA